MAASTSFSLSFPVCRSYTQASHFGSPPSPPCSSNSSILGIRLLPYLQKPMRHELMPLPSTMSRFIVRASIFPFSKKKDKEALKQELLEAIAPLDRGVAASSADIARVEKLAQNLESVNPVKQTITSPLINGKWELLYTTSSSVLKKQRPKLLRPGPIFQAINNDTLRAQNIELWPFFNQVTANLTPVSGKKVAVKFDFFKIAGLISIKAPETARGELEITYLDEELRVSRGDKGNLFILKMADPLYRVPT